MVWWMVKRLTFNRKTYMLARIIIYIINSLVFTYAIYREIVSDSDKTIIITLLIIVSLISLNLILGIVLKFIKKEYSNYFFHSIIIMVIISFMLILWYSFFYEPSSLHSI